MGTEEFKALLLAAHERCAGAGERPGDHEVLLHLVAALLAKRQGGQQLHRWAACIRG